MDPATWSPFQSREVREICAHMTSEERNMAMRHGLLYGVWVFATFVGPLGLAWRVQTPWAWLLAAGLVLAHIACIPHWQARVRRLLSSTKWARERGYTADLRLFQFRLR